MAPLPAYSSAFGAVWSWRGRILNLTRRDLRDQIAAPITPAGRFSPFGQVGIPDRLLLGEKRTLPEDEMAALDVQDLLEYARASVGSFEA